MNYQINDETLAVVPHNNKNCEVIEKFGNYPLSNSTLKVIEHSCEYFGVNYKTRLKGTQKFINTRYKPPVMIEESSKLIFFPINSPKNEDNYWLSYNNILNFYASDNKNETIVNFKNGITMTIPVSFYRFNSQYSKAAKLYGTYCMRTAKKR